MLMLLGASYSEALSWPPRERRVMEIILGTLRGGEYNFQEGRWIKFPTIL
jgi:hypothetical protein